MRDLLKKRMDAKQEAAMLGLFKNRDINNIAFINDTELLLEMIGGGWYKTKEDMQPLLNRLEKAVNDVLDDPEAALHVSLCLQWNGADTQALEAVRDSFKFGYKQMPRSFHREEIVNQARQVFEKHGLPIATGNSSPFVKYLRLILQVAELAYDGREMARQFK